MLIPQHPRSVARCRAVAELSVASQQAPAIEPGHVVQAAGAAPPGGDPEADEAGAPKAPPICFPVVYRLPEYLAVLREHLPRQLLAAERARGGRLSWRMRVALRVLVPLVGTPMFLLKKRRMPVCRFRIDAAGIEREAGGGRLVLAWDEVVAVHRLRGVWRVDTGRGGLPLPHRCLDLAQRAALERLLVLFHARRVQDGARKSEATH
jgi:hypothetical protein